MHAGGLPLLIAESQVWVEDGAEEPWVEMG